MERRELLRAWLRSKGYHPIDIAAGLNAFDNNSTLTDTEIAAISDKSHSNAVDTYAPLPVTHKHLIPSVFKPAFWGGFSGAIIVEIGKFLWHWTGLVW